MRLVCSQHGLPRTAGIVLALLFAGAALGARDAQAGCGNYVQWNGRSLAAARGHAPRVAPATRQQHSPQLPCQGPECRRPPLAPPVSQSPVSPSPTNPQWAVLFVERVTDPGDRDATAPDQTPPYAFYSPVRIERPPRS